MEHKQVFLTEEGQKKVAAELEQLRNVRRMEVAGRIQRAKELESTANNAEYDDAKNEQAFVEGRILMLETTLSSATVVHEHQTARVDVGSVVKLLDKEGEEETYTIVGSAEASPAEGRISNESPVGQALMGKKVGAHIEVSAPAGLRKLKLVQIR